MVLAGARGRLRRGADGDRAAGARPGPRDLGDARRGAAGRSSPPRSSGGGNYRGAGEPGAKGCRWRSSWSLVLSIPFAISGRWGLLGVGFNNDLGLHLAWAEWLRSGFGPDAEPGYPLGPHGLAVATAAVPGIGLGQAFLGEIVAIGVMTGLTALGALRELTPGRRTLAAAMVALPYLAASYYAQAAFKETAEALLVLAFAIWLTAVRGPACQSWRDRVLFVLPPLALAGGIFFSYSFAGLAWPVAILALWSLTLPAVRAALRPRALLRFLLRPLTLLTLVSSRRAGGAGHPGRPLRLRRQLQQSRRQQHLRPGLSPGGAGNLAGLQLPPRRRRRRPPTRPGGRSCRSSPCWRASPGGCDAANWTIPIALGAAWLLYLVSLPSAATTPWPRR